MGFPFLWDHKGQVTHEFQFPVITTSRMVSKSVVSSKVQHCSSHRAGWGRTSWTPIPRDVIISSFLFLNGQVARQRSIQHIAQHYLRRRENAAWSRPEAATWGSLAMLLRFAWVASWKKRLNCLQSVYTERRTKDSDCWSALEPANVTMVDAKRDQK